MPNWCYQKLAVSGQAADIAAFKAAYFNDKGKLELNRVIPMPESLNIESGSQSMTGYDALYGNWERMLNWPRFASLPDEAKVDRASFVAWLQEAEPNCIKLGHLARENLAVHGFRDWYGWRVRYWGVKWEIGDNQQEMRSDEPTFLDLSFETAWSPILPVLERMSEFLPSLLFELWYLDEGGGFAGLASAQAGVVSDQDQDWRKTASEQFGWDFSDEEGDVA